jgi:hypothetical protein
VLTKVEQVKQRHEAELAYALQQGVEQGRAERQNEIDQLRAGQQHEIDQLRAGQQHDADQMRQMQVELVHLRAIMGVAASEGTRD